MCPSATHGLSPAAAPPLPAELYFPLLRTRFEVPAKQSADHRRIVGLMQASLVAERTGTELLTRAAWA